MAPIFDGSFMQILRTLKLWMCISSHVYVVFHVNHLIVLHAGCDVIQMAGKLCNETQRVSENHWHLEKDCVVSSSFSKSIQIYVCI